MDAKEPPTNRTADPELRALVELARSGDAKSEAALLKVLEGPIRGFFLRRVGHHNELDDLVQNTLVRVFRGLADVKDGGRIKGFAMKAAFFELQDLFRGRYESREAALSPDAMDPAVRPTTDGTAIDIDRALAKLTPHARRIIELKVLGYRYEEIAEELNSTEAAVKMQVKRALERLRGILLTLAVLLPLGPFLLLFVLFLRL